MGKLQEILSQPLSRMMTLQKETINATERTIEFSCSSETVVDRGWWKEILDHSMTSIRLGRLLNSAPLLYMHDPCEQIGVVLNSFIDETEKKLRVLVKFSKNEDAEEIWQDINDGIVRNVSVGYRIYNLVLDNKDGDVETYRIMDWEPLEVSIVSIPADDNVGIGRNLSITNDLVNERLKSLEDKIINIKTRGINMDAENVQRPEDLQAAELKRVQEIEALGKRKGMEYRWAVENKLSIEQYRGFIIDNLGSGEPLYTPATDLGLSNNEKRAYSISKAIRAQLTGNWDKAKRELEYSQEISKRLQGKTPRGFFVPVDALTRDMTATGGGSTGGYLVGTNLQPQSFIELLLNKMLAKTLGAKSISGLQGNVAISRKTAKGTAYWVGEGTVSKSDMTLGQLVLSPKTVAAYEQYSKQLLMQATPAIDSLVNGDILDAIALEIDRVIFHGLGNTNQPMGIKGTSGVNAVTGTSFTYATALEYQSKVEVANAMANGMGYVTTPTVRATLKGRAKVSNYPDYICDSANNCAGYKMEATNQIETGHIFFGDFSQVLIGDWGVLDVVIDPYTLAADNLTRVIAHQMIDVAVRQPGAFSVSTSIS